MSIKHFLFYIFLTFFVNSKSNAQNSYFAERHETTYFISINSGIQMSGIKDEDFVSSNYSPLFNITAGKWFTPYLALQVGYKGFYFNAIADEIKHHYNYFYGETVINLNNFIAPDRENRNWNLHLHAGPGYFYNHVYGRAGLQFNVGIQNTFQFSKNFNFSIDIASILGWDIYQGNLDILPGLMIGGIYLFSL